MLPNAKSQTCFVLSDATPIATIAVCSLLNTMPIARSDVTRAKLVDQLSARLNPKPRHARLTHARRLGQNIAQLSAADAGGQGSQLIQLPCRFVRPQTGMDITRASAAETDYYYQRLEAKERAARHNAAVANFVGGFIPGVGEAMDIYTLFAPDSDWGDRSLSGVSLVANVFTAGFAPNFGSWGKAGKKLLELSSDSVRGVSKAGDAAIDFSRATGNILDAAPSATSAEQGGLNLFKWGQPQTKAGGWQTGDRMLYLRDQGVPKLNWQQNSGRLRAEMGQGKLIFDTHIDPATSQPIPTDGFLRAERHLLGERQDSFYLPRGLLGRMKISYLGKSIDRSSRLLSAFISFGGTLTPIG